MKEWTRKRKADVCMGILLQIYFFFPWIRIDGGYHTIHVYLIEIFRKESCIKAYNYIFLSGHPILWKYSGFAAVTFTMIIAFMIVMQMIELWQLYRHMKGIKTFDIHRYVWVLAIVLFFLFHCFYDIVHFLLLLSDAPAENFIRLFYYFYLSGLNHMIDAVHIPTVTDSKGIF